MRTEIELRERCVTPLTAPGCDRRGSRLSKSAQMEFLRPLLGFTKLDAYKEMRSGRYRRAWLLRKLKRVYYAIDLGN
jgi:hypothetical protein